MGDELPSRTEVHRARKAELQAWCQEFGLDDEGTVAELKDRLLGHLEAQEAAEEPAGEEEVPEAEAEEEEAREEEREDEVEFLEEEQEGHVVRQKPELPSETEALLDLRDRMKAHRPSFRRQEWHRYRKLGEKWRKPRGHHSKLRRGLRYRGATPSAGRRGPREVRSLHPSGFEEVLVHRPDDLEGLDPKTQAARIAHSVGTRKRLAIQDRADDLGVRILNRVVG